MPPGSEIDFALDVRLDLVDAVRDINLLEKRLAEADARAKRLTASFAGMSNALAGIGRGVAFQNTLNAATEAGRNLSQELATVPYHMREIETTGVSAATKIRTAFLALGIGAAVRRGVAQLSELGAIQNQLRLVTDGTDELRQTTEDLFQIANETRSSYETTASLYFRVALSSRQLGLSQKKTAAFTRSLNHAVILSGANAREANAALIQLAQGIASARLGGEELRSVLEQLPVVADVIAKQMGVTRGELRELGGEGKITAATILEAFENASDELAADFEKTVPTIAQAFTILGNHVIAALAAFDEATGFTGKFVAVLQFLSENLELISKLAGAVALHIGIRLTDALVAKAAPAVILFSKTLLSRGVPAIRGFGKALRANPVGILLTALQYVLPVIISFTDWIGDAIDAVAGFIESSETLQAVGSVLKTVLEAVATAIEFIVEASIEGAKAVRDLGLELSSLVNNFGPLADKVKEVTDAAREQARGQRALAEAVTFAADAWNVAGEAIRLANEQRLDSNDLVESSLEKIREETNALLLNARQRAYLTALAEAEKQARKQDRELREDEILAIQQQIEYRFALEEATKRLAKAEKGGSKAAQKFMRQYHALRDQISEQVAARRELTEAQRILNIAERKNLITGIEREQLEGELRNRLEEKLDPMEAFIKAQKQERALLKLSNEERELEEDLLEVTNALRRAYGEKIGPGVVDFLRKELEQTRALAQWKKLEIALVEAFTKAKNDAIKAREEERARMAELRAEFGRTLEAKQREIELQNLELQGRNSLAEARRIEQQFAERGLQLSTEQVQKLQVLNEQLAYNATLYGGLRAAGVDAFSQMREELLDFIVLGEQEFGDMIDSMLKQLAKLMLQLLLFQALSAGGVGAPLAAGLSGFGGGLPGFATGGTMTVGGHGGTDSQVVAFRATPRETVTVTPPGRAPIMNAPAAPPVNMSVTNALSDGDIARSIDSTDGERALLNRMNRDPAKFRRALGLD